MAASVGIFNVSKKNSPGAQAADFLAYCVYQTELLEHGTAPSAVEKSSYVTETPLVANVCPQPVPQSGPIVFRIPISQDVPRSLKEGLFASATRASATAPV
jgi:hypothetical protein